MELLARPAASHWLPGENASASTAWLFDIVLIYVPVAASHKRIACPASPEASHFPFGDQASESILSLWPARRMASRPWAPFHTRILLSAPAAHTHLPPGENA